MILFPAVDLKDEKCVRLTRGDVMAATVYNDDPVEQARLFEKAGFKWLHLVDLNGAIEGRSVNAIVINDIVRDIGIPVQLGGGIRTLASIERWLSAGVSRVILGTIALRDPQLVREASRAFPGRIAVSIDARGGMVAVSGWVENSSVTATELATEFEDAGVAAIIFTDIDRDGTGQGLDIAGVKTLAGKIQIPVIAAGGVGSLADIDAARAAGLHGVIIGCSLYDGALDPKAALRHAAGRV